MLRAGTTVLFLHEEARHEVKTRPAVILQVLGDEVLLVFGQSRAPVRDEALEIGPKAHLPDRGAGLDNTTFFGSQSVLAVSADRIVRRIGQVSPRRFMALDELTTERRMQLAEKALSEANTQRSHLRDSVEAHIRDHHAQVDEVADEAKLARARLRQIIYSDVFWTREELHAIAHVLGVAPGALLKPAQRPED